MPAHRMHRGLVALSASAVAAIYMAGYLRTRSADATLGATAAPLAVAASASAATAPPEVTAAPGTRVIQVRTPIPVQGGPTSAPAAVAAAPVAPTATPPAVPTAAAVAAAPASYKDGTYTGQGSSRRGDVWVSIQIQAGRIAQVSITRSTLQYPLRDIAGLPNQVVQRQSAQVDIVSRATYSSQAFRGAVAQALASAIGG